MNRSKLKLNEKGIDIICINNFYSYYHTVEVLKFFQLHISQTLVTFSENLVSQYNNQKGKRRTKGRQEAQSQQVLEDRGGNQNNL